MESSLANDHGSDSTRSLVLFVIISLISYNFIYIIYKREREGGEKEDYSSSTPRRIETCDRLVKLVLKNPPISAFP